MSETAVKSCTRCAKEKPVSEFARWGKARDFKPKAHCKECASAMGKANYAANKGRASAVNKEWMRNNSDRRKEYKAEYRSRAEVKERERANGRSSYARNRDKRIQAVRAYAEANREGVAKRARDYYQKNSEEIKARTAAWARRNPHKVSTRSAGRRYAKGKVGWVTWADIESVYREARRVSEATGVPHDVDHIYPLKGKTVSGLNTPDNLRIVTSSLNMRKRNKLPGHLAHELWDPTGPDVFQEEQEAHQCTRQQSTTPTGYARPQ